MTPTSRILVLAAVAAACDGPTVISDGLPPNTGEALPVLSCSISPDNVISGGVGRSAIPALVNPTLVTADHPEAAYVTQYANAATGGGDDPLLRVVGLLVDGTPVAIPHNILWWHEIVNLEMNGRKIVVSYCPLTGSALAFDAARSQTATLGVSGLIFQNNLVMFDESTESLWPQMCERAIEGDRIGDQLTRFPAIEMTWHAWTARHPNTLVVSDQTGFQRDYTRYPYPTYEISDFVAFPLPRALDERRFAKERVIAVPTSTGGLAFPFGELQEGGTLAVVSTNVDGNELVVLWDEAAASAAVFMSRTLTQTDVRLRVVDGQFTDAQTGSVWNVEGVATQGPLAGERLEPFVRSYVAYWFAWASFYPRTALWEFE